MNAFHSLSSQNTTPPRNLVGRSPPRLSEKRWLGSPKKGQPSPKRKAQFSTPTAFYKATKPGTFVNNRKEKAQKWLALSKYHSLIRLFMREFPAAREAILDVLAQELAHEFSDIKREGLPVLEQDVSISTLNSFNWNEALDDLGHALPIATRLVGACYPPTKSFCRSKTLGPRRNRRSVSVQKTFKLSAHSLTVSLHH